MLRKLLTGSSGIISSPACQNVDLELAVSPSLNYCMVNLKLQSRQITSSPAFLHWLVQPDRDVPPPLLFALAIEPRAIALRAAKDCEGTERGHNNKLLYMQTIDSYSSQTFQNRCLLLCQSWRNLGKYLDTRWIFPKVSCSQWILKSDRMNTSAIPDQINLKYLEVNISQNFCHLFKHNFSKR